MNHESTTKQPMNNTQPISIEIVRAFDVTTGQWHAQASVRLTDATRTSGLLQAIPAEDLKNLLFLLSFTSPNGDCAPTVQQLAHALGVSDARVRERYERLSQFTWQGRPLVQSTKRGDGSEAWTANGQTVIARTRDELTTIPAETLPIPPEEPTDAKASEAKTASRPEPNRHTVILAERERLATKLRELGIDEDKADYLAANYEASDIQRQVDWLPHRHVRNPARFIVSAIERGYEEPFGLRGKTEAR